MDVVVKIIRYSTVGHRLVPSRSQYLDDRVRIKKNVHIVVGPKYRVSERLQCTGDILIEPITCSKTSYENDVLIKSKYWY